MNTLELGWFDLGWLLLLLDLTIVAILWALGFGCVQPLVRSLVLERSPPERWGAANATMQGNNQSGFVIWRNGRTSIYRNPKQINP